LFNNPAIPGSARILGEVRRNGDRPIGGEEGLVAAQDTAWLSTLAEDRAAMGRASTASRVAGVLRTRIIEGLLLPGTRLSEEEIGEALGVSRNTLREAFRLLGHERLLVHEFNRGVFVRSLRADDIRDLYRVRRILEIAAVRHAATGGEDLSDVRDAVSEGQEAARRDDWPGVGTANMHFHTAVAALAGSPRVDEVMQQLLAELRLVFAVMADPRSFHETYLAENQALYELLVDGRFEEAERVLADYLDRAEEQLLVAMDRRAGQQSTRERDRRGARGGRSG
jgi:DNA-binding GntR family transcriptional regulator